VGGDPISDSDGDGVFDGQTFDAEIAVDTACPPDAVVLTPRPGSATPSPKPSASPTVEAKPTSPVDSPTPGATPPKANNNEDSTWTSNTWIAGYAVGGLAVLLVGAALVTVARRRSG